MRLQPAALTLLAAAASLALAACGEPETPLADETEIDRPRPETPAPGMVAAAHPLAVEAGLDALRAGGDAVDAAIAVQAVLGLVEPQSSGLGGGAFMLRYDAATGAVVTYDGRETAPSGVTPELFLTEDGEEMGFLDAWVSGRSVGAPGVIAMLAMAHEEHGALAWSEGFNAAARLAEDGFAVPPRFADLTARIARFSPLDEREDTRAYFYDADGEPYAAGDVITNPAYAESARAIAADWRNFYEGPLAEAIVEAVRREPNPGALSLQDLADYAPERREALCAPYRMWRVCSAPPPASGGVAVNQILGLLEGFDMAAAGDTPQGWHLFIEASRLAYADRDRYVGDPAFVDVPVRGLLDRAYLAERAALIDPEAAMARAEAGTPPGAGAPGADRTDDAPGTSHFVVVDADGDVVSMTTTVESPFGSHRMAGGFLLNNQLTDFAFTPTDADGRPLANAVAPGKRPRSSMSPVIVLDRETGAFVLATGSPGGNSIIAYTAKSLVAMLDWGMSPETAAALPNVVARGDVARIEEGFGEDRLEALRALGHEVEGGRGENSGIHIVRRGPDGRLDGAADPRRDGAARLLAPETTEDAAPAADGAG